MQENARRTVPTEMFDGFCMRRPTPAALNVRQFPLAAQFDGYELAAVFADVDLARARDLLLRVLQYLLPLRQPAHRARDAEQHSELLGFEAHGLVDDPRVKVHVRVELALDEILVGEGNALQFEGDIGFRPVTANASSATRLMMRARGS